MLRAAEDVNGRGHSEWGKVASTDEAEMTLVARIPSASVILRPHTSAVPKMRRCRGRRISAAMIAVGFLDTSRRVRSMRLHRHENPMTALLILRFFGRETICGAPG